MKVESLPISKALLFRPVVILSAAEHSEGSGLRPRNVLRLPGICSPRGPDPSALPQDDRRNLVLLLPICECHFRVAAALGLAKMACFVVQTNDVINW